MFAGFWIIPVPLLLLAWALTGAGVWSIVIADIAFRFLQYALALATGWLMPVGVRDHTRRLSLLALGAMAIHSATTGVQLLSGVEGAFGSLFFANMPYQLSTILALAWLGQMGRAALERQKLLAETAVLQARIAHAQTLAYRAHLQPEFVLGCLAKISEAMREDPRAADDILLEMSDLLRQSLSRLRTDEIQLQSEIAFLSAYLRLERLRSGVDESIQVSVEPGLGTAIIPTGLLTDLVREVASRADGGSAGRLAVVASASDGQLSISVSCGEGTSDFSGAAASTGGAADARSSPGLPSRAAGYAAHPPSHPMRVSVPLRFESSSRGGSRPTPSNGESNTHGFRLMPPARSPEG